MNERLKTGLSAKTVKYHLSVLRMSLGQALKWNFVARNVAMLVDPPRLVKFEVQPISPEHTARATGRLCADGSRFFERCGR